MAKGAGGMGREGWAGARGAWGGWEGRPWSWPRAPPTRERAGVGWVAEGEGRGARVAARKGWGACRTRESVCRAAQSQPGYICCKAGHAGMPAERQGSSQQPSKEAGRARQTHGTQVPPTRVYSGAQPQHLSASLAQAVQPSIWQGAQEPGSSAYTP